MNKIEIYQRIQSFQEEFAGVFSKEHLQNLFLSSLDNRFYRSVRFLEQSGVLIRFCRSFYVCSNFDPKTLSQRLCESSYISLGSALAEHQIIDSIPAKNIQAIKIGKNRIYQNAGITISHYGIQKDLFFGYENKNGVKFATAEKSFLDTLYFYQKGKKFSFNIYHDLNIDNLDQETIFKYLKKYKNPKFIQFVRGYFNVRKN